MGNHIQILGDRGDEFLAGRILLADHQGKVRLCIADISGQLADGIAVEIDEDPNHLSYRDVKIVVAEKPWGKARKKLSKKKELRAGAGAGPFRGDGPSRDPHHTSDSRGAASGSRPS